VLHPRWLAHEILGVIRDNRFWMTWNLLLALVPAVLGVLLLWRPHRRTPLWWLGIGAFVLFLPNAPYVLTDVVHLPGDITFANSRSVVLFGVLPLYAAFMWLGVSSYVLCLELVVREVHTAHPTVSRRAVEIPIHALCALGIVLGRVARVNSWDTVQDPRWTAAKTFNALSWDGAPFAWFGTFVCIWVATTLVRGVYRLAFEWGDRMRARLSPAA